MGELMTRIDVLMALGKALRAAKIDAELTLYKPQVMPVIREFAEKAGWSESDARFAFACGGGQFNGLRVGARGA
jgi:tRNA A37 threonylcarbamoyladenosine modification protein TsaB